MCELGVNSGTSEVFWLPQLEAVGRHPVIVQFKPTRPLRPGHTQLHLYYSPPPPSISNQLNRSLIDREKLLTTSVSYQTEISDTFISACLFYCVVIALKIFVKQYKIGNTDF